MTIPFETFNTAPNPRLLATLDANFARLTSSASVDDGIGAIGFDDAASYPEGTAGDALRRALSAIALVQGTTNQITITVTGTGDSETLVFSLPSVVAISGAFTAGGNISTSGTVSAGGAVSANSATVGAGGISTSGNVASSGDIAAVGSVAAGQTVVVGSAATISGVTGNFATAGSVTAGGNVACTGSLSAGGNVACTGSLSAGGNATIGGTLTVAEAATFVRPPVIKGIEDGTNAAAGKVGEILTASVGSATTIMPGTIGSAASLTLSPGDWDIQGVALWQFSSSNVLSHATQGISLNSTSFSAAEFCSTHIINAVIPGESPMPTPFVRMSNNISRTIYLSVRPGPPGSVGFDVKGYIRARRVR